MPVKTKIDPAQGVRVHTVTGELTVHELKATLVALYDDPNFQSGHDALWDLREASLTGFTADDVRHIVNLVKDGWVDRGSAKAAMVVSRTADFGMVRMYEIQLATADEDRTSVFRDIDEAYAWLDHNPPQ